MTFFGDIALPIVLFIIMIGIGMSTQLTDFKSLLQYPKAAILGILSQLFLLPLIALGLAEVFNYSDNLTLGLLLLSLCPSGTGSNIIAKMLKGNLALSVSLTGISSVKSLFTIPLIIGAYLQFSSSTVELGTIPYWELSTSVFLLTIIPTLIGIGISIKTPQVVEKSKTLLKWLLPGLLFSVFVAIMFLDDQSESEVNVLEMLIPAIIFNVISMLSSFAFVKFFKVENNQALAISIEGGLKNSAVGLLIAHQFLNIASIELFILAYSFVSFYLTFVLGLGLRKLNPQ